MFHGSVSSLKDGKSLNAEVAKRLQNLHKLSAQGAARNVAQLGRASKIGAVGPAVAARSEWS
jgi:hypothetical protein